MYSSLAHHLPKRPSALLAASFSLTLALLTWPGSLRANNWPSYRADLSRSAQTENEIPKSLKPSWVFKSTHRPIPAWPMPGEETPRMHTDRALHVVVHEQTAFFGSSVDHLVRAVDTRSGALKWQFFANAAVRFAPQVEGDHLYFGADDGLIYCLDIHTGKKLWSNRPGPAAERIIGTGNMIATWPVRTGLAVRDGVVYAAAGIFPYEGLYITALNAEDGSEIWKNDTAGDLAWGLEYGGMAPQGYLLLSGDTLYVPSGRGMPAAFDRHTGTFKKFLSQGAKTGGSWALIDQGKLVAGVSSQGDAAKIVYDESGKKQGHLFASFQGIDVVLTSDVAYTLTPEGVIAVDRAANQREQTDSPKIAKEIKSISQQVAAVRAALKSLPDSRDSETSAARSDFRSELTRLTGDIADLNDQRDQLTADCVRWKYPATGLTSIARAGDAILCGTENQVVCLNAKTGGVQWQQETDDLVLGLAIADSRVFASTVSGSIYCFAEAPGQSATQHQVTLSDQAFRNSPNQQLFQRAAEAILEQSKIKKGFCLVLDSQTGQLAFEMASRSDLKFVLPVSDAAKLREIRDRLLPTGLYGRRIIAVPWSYAELPDYFANLVVSESLVVQPGISVPAADVTRLIRPAGGVAVLGSPTRSGIASLVSHWANKSDLPASKSSSVGDNWVRFERGKLPGAGTWNGLYGDAGNTGSSPDELVKGPLGVLWFGEPGSEYMLDRHARSTSPLAVNGRLFVQGMEVVMGYDAYNGTFLWQRNIKGAVRSRVDVDGSNLFATDESLFVAAEDRTLQLDAQTGTIIREFKVPQKSDQSIRRWGYISVKDGILFGSGAIPLRFEYGHTWNDMITDGQWKSKSEIPDFYHTIKARRSAIDESIVDYFLRKYPTPNKGAYDEFKRDGYHWKFSGNFPGWLPDHTPSPVTDKMMISDSVFAFDIESGRLLWHREGHHIPQISLTLGDEHLFFVDGGLTETEKEAAALDRQKQITNGVYQPHDESNLAFDERDFRRVVALDPRTGATDWSRVMDLSGAGGNKLGAAFKDGRLLFFGHYSNHDQTPFAQGKLSWRRITVLNANNGDTYWSKPLNYRRRPLIVEDTLFIEPRAASLTTGEIKMRQHPITGAEVEWEFLRPGHSCGVVTATPNNLFFRSYSAAIVNLEQDSGLQLFGGTRPGCWNSMIPANGLLTMQESSAGCTCSYALRTTVAMKTKRQKGPGEWAVFISQTPTLPVSHMALNLGAPGDLRDPDGTLWFAYPRPDTSDGQGPFKDYGVKFDLKENKSIAVTRRDYRGIQIKGSQQPWLFTSAVQGLKELHVPLLDETESGKFTVRMGFTAHKGQRKGQRVFDIHLQNTPVLESFDVLEHAQGPREAIIREFTGIDVEDQLHFQFASHARGSGLEQAPMVQFIEITREDKQPKKARFLNPVH